MPAAQINNNITLPGCYLSLALTYHILAFYHVQWYWLLCKVTLSCHYSLSSKLSINLKRGITIMIIHQPLCTCITNVNLFHIIIPAPSTGLRTTELINSWVAPERWKSVQDHFRLYKSIMSLKLRVIYNSRMSFLLSFYLFAFGKKVEDGKNLPSIMTHPSS